MPYLFNSLVFLIITLFSWNISPSFSDENDIFLLPKKKISKVVNDKIKAIISTKGQNQQVDSLPKKKPLNTKTIKQEIYITENKKKNLDIEKPIKKPSIISKKLKVEKKKGLVEKDKKKQEVAIEKDKLVTKKIIVKNTDSFLYPIKKPVTFKIHSSKRVVKSSILNAPDYINAKEVFNLIKKSKWDSALLITKKIKDKEFNNLVTWLYLKETGNRASFNDYSNFISKNPNYPRINRLRYLAEQKIILKNTTPKEIVNWFDVQEPLSGIGKIKLGEALLQLGENARGVGLIKSGWTTAKLSSNDLKFYRKKFKNFIKTNDHLKRADYMAWNNKYWDLKRRLRYLPKDERLLYNARFVLMTHSYGVDKAISEVPGNLQNDIGLKYDRLKWRNRRNRLESSIEILENSPANETELIRADLWWLERKDITRDLIYKKDYSLAYKVASNNFLSEGPEFAEAEWLSGWLALRFLDNPDTAIEHFENFYKNVGYPISLARGAFWLGMAHEKAGNKEKSKKYFKDGSLFTNTYYGQLSFNKINFGEDFKLVKEFKHSKDYEKEFNKNILIRHVRLLKELDETKFSKDIIKHLATINIEKGSEVLAAKLASEVDRYDYSIQISKSASYEKRFINSYNYPVIETPKSIKTKIMPNQELILAIIRQESEFDSRANSYVGARGMMQLMPATAKLVSKRIKINYNKRALTSDPNYNIKLGTYYFNMLLEDYNGVYPFAIAAYNAGPNRVKTWKKKYGDPSKNQIDFIDWIELIRFKETRNYVQRVIENINVYKYILNNNSSIKIDKFFID